VFSRTIERKRRIALFGRLPNIRVVGQRSISQCPADSERVYARSSLHGGSPGDGAIVQRHTTRDQWITEQFTHGQSTPGNSSHGDRDRAETEEVFSQRIAMKSFHGEAVSGWQGSYPTARHWIVLRVTVTATQLASIGWRGNHATARQRGNSEGFWCSPATHSCIGKRHSL